MWDISHIAVPTQVASFTGHTGPNIWSLALWFDVSTDKHVILTGGGDGGVRRWDWMPNQTQSNLAIYRCNHNMYNSKRSRITQCSPSSQGRKSKRRWCHEFCFAFNDNDGRFAATRVRTAFLNVDIEFLIANYLRWIFALTRGIFS